jgi:hypothetical protein
MHCPRQVVYQPNMHYEQWNFVEMADLTGSFA